MKGIGLKQLDVFYFARSKYRTENLNGALNFVRTANGFFLSAAL